MNKLYPVLLFFGIAISSLARAQTWKPLGMDEASNPSVGYTSSNTIAIAPDGTPYIAFADNAYGGTGTVKKFDGKKWVPVGKQGFTEGYYVSGISLAFSNDGTPHIAYNPSISGQNFITVSIRKFVGDNWVKEGYPVGTGIYPTLAVGPDDMLYSGFSRAYGVGLAVRKFTNTWEDVGDVSDVSGSPMIYNRIAVAADGTVYAAYAALKSKNKVSVKKLVAGKWQFVGTESFSNAGALNTTMAVAADGTPYVAYQDSTQGNIAVVQQFKNGVWTVVSPANLSKGAAAYINVATGPDQSLYVTFCDAGDNSKPIVKKLSGGIWTSVGQGYLPTGQANYTSIAVAPNGTPYLFYSDYVMNGKAVVKMFTNGQWIDVGMGSVSTQSSGNAIVKVSKTGAIYTAFADAINFGKVSVKQYVSGTWQNLGAATISTKGILTVGSNPPELDMDLAPDGTPYVVYRDSTQASCYVKKFNGTAWISVGSDAVTTSYGGIFFKIAVAPDGTPYVAYGDNNYSGALTIQKFVNGNWVYVGKSGLSTSFIYNASLAFDKNNVPYVAYVGYAGGSIKAANVKKFDGTNWVTVGTDNFTGANAISDINIVIGADFTPYVTFYDGTASKLVVDAFTNNTWQAFGGPAPSTTLASFPKLTFDPNGLMYLSFLQYNSTTYVTAPQIRKLSAGAWIDAGSAGVTPYWASAQSLGFMSNGDAVFVYVNSMVFGRTKTGDDLAAAPIVNTVYPTNGITGTEVTISGFNFSNASAVKFGGAAAASYTVTSPTQITAIIGAGATGAVSISTPNGTTSFGQFNYTINAPIIKAFSPRSGNVGTIVTIKGKYFGTAAADNTVYFGASAGQVITANDSILTVKVLAGASYGPITLTTRQLTAVASAFNVTFKSQGTFSASTFASKQNVGSSGGPYAVAVKDMDGDGKPDVMIGGSSVLANTSTAGNISFTAASNDVTRANQDVIGYDMDGDTKPDMVVTSGVTIFLYKNSGTSGALSFLPYGQSIQPNDYPTFSLIGDIDGDGRPDIIGNSTSASNLSVFRNSGTSKNFTAFEDQFTLGLDANSWGATLADIDGDGKPEIITLPTNYNGGETYNLAIYKNVSSPYRIGFTKFTNAITMQTGKRPGNPVIADIDGDGKLDILVPNNHSNTVSVFKNIGTVTAPAFAAGVEIATGTAPNSLAVADLDGDGLPDIATSNNGNTISVLKNTSTFTTMSFAAKIDYPTTYQPGTIVAADLDGDQAPELIVSNYLGNNATIFKNGLGVFSLPVTNFTVTALSATCKGTGNGSINISAAQAYTYTSTLTGNGLTKTTSFTTSGGFTTLPAGTYNVCITLAEAPGFQQCYDVVVSEPKDIALYSTVNTNNNSVDVALTGGNIYYINLNGVKYINTTGVINLRLNAGNNRLSVSTDKECQGTVEKLINLSGVISPYPVPFQNALNINIGLTLVKKIDVQLYSLTAGKPVYAQQFTNQSGVLQLDVSGLKSGIYTLHLNLDSSESVYKVIKQ